MESVVKIIPGIGLPPTNSPESNSKVYKEKINTLKNKIETVKKKKEAIDRDPHEMARKSYYRDRYYRQKYKLSLKQVIEMIVDQDKKCAICRKFPKNETMLHVDHDHTTGKVRGLLCAGCNTGLGKLGDYIEPINRVAEYLKHGFKKEKHNAKKS